jgi:hypothetical protein
MFDGIISALHYDPTIASTDPVSELIAVKLRITPAQIADSLRNSTNAILGSRKVVSPYREFVKWNPADELCLVGQLLVQHRESPSWSIEIAVSPLHSSFPAR